MLRKEASPTPATSRAYYAMFWAAQAALGRAGVRRSEWTHAALLASFASDLIRRRKVYPAVLGQHFNRAIQLRLDADYRLAGVSLNHADKVVRWAHQFVTAIINRCPMAQTIQRCTDHRAGLDAAVTAFSLFIRDLCPEAHLEVSFVQYEDEDAHIWVSPPPRLTEQERENLANQVAEKSIDLLLSDGFLILGGVEEP